MLYVNIFVSDSSSEVEPGNGGESDDDNNDDDGVGMEGGLEDEARGLEAKKT